MIRLPRTPDRLVQNLYGVFRSRPLLLLLVFGLLLPVSGRGKEDAPPRIPYSSMGAIIMGEVPRPDDENRDAFSERVKLEPFRRALAEHDPDSWITALRREQTEFRDGLSPFQRVNDGILKICPLIDWRGADMVAYMALNQLPGEDDYYDPTKAEPHLECGIHNRL